MKENKKHIRPRLRQGRYQSHRRWPRQKRIRITQYIVLILVVVLGLSQIKSIYFSSSQPQEKTTETSKQTETKETVDTSNYPSVTIVIDPGHGGYDGGSIGADEQTYEKDLNLEYSLQIGKELETLNPNLHIIYTRTSDTVTWPENEEEDLIARVEFAKEQNAQYFLSVHFNAQEESDDFGYAGFIRKNDTVSKYIYNRIASNLEKQGWSLNTGIGYSDDYPLYVVSEQDIPSLLFEVGYISNYSELQSLLKDGNKKMICKAIAQGYHSYILDHA